MMLTARFAAFYFLAIIVGCSSSYTVEVEEGLPNRVYLNFDKGTSVKVGDQFALYQYHQASPSGSGHAHGGGGSSTLRHDVGRVRVVRIVNEIQAEVVVISGRAEAGLLIEEFR